ncbi:hypothetical protein [Microvirga sp. BSC39]|uniref:hypothetical protein n=1 Tax=Microvirga sp. BSC39 TaxID=1549810 RepID=UPI0004E8AE37|nr:hypothetical protein [Microvirga sp. BSC39]KFG69930.1 hypothetical protein JH26_07185 [Microvirga sp. BSC39]
MFKALVFSAVLIFGCTQAGWAVDPPLQLPLCPDWSQNVETDIGLWQALEAAYPSVTVAAEVDESSRTSCLFPDKLLRYHNVEVLITLAGEPGKDCHGCPAQLSAVFLKRDGRVLKPVGRHKNFAETGTFGNVISLGSFEFGSRQGMVIEGGGTFQGYTTTVFVFYAIKNRRLRQIGPKNGISSGDSNCGAIMDEGPCRDVIGEWQVEGDRLKIRYSGVREDRTRISGTVVYRFKGDALILLSGAILAAEMQENRP